MKKELAVGFDLGGQKNIVALAKGGSVIRSFKLSFSEGRALALNRLDNQLRQEFPNHHFISAFEAGGKLEIHDQLTELGWENHVVPSHRIPKTDALRWNKTDFADAENLADNLSLGKIQGKPTFDKEHRKFQKLVRKHRDLVEQRASIKQEFREILNEWDIRQPVHITSGILRKLLKVHHKLREAPNVCKNYDRLILLDNQISSYQSDISEHLILSRYSAFSAELQNIVGISVILSAELIAELGDFGRFRTFSEFKSFCGLAPYRFQSGMVDRHYKPTYSKPPELKRTFKEAVRCLTTHNEKYKRLKAQYERDNPRYYNIKLQRAFAKEIFHLWQC